MRVENTAIDIGSDNLETPLSLWIAGHHCGASEWHEHVPGSAGHRLPCWRGASLVPLGYQSLPALFYCLPASYHYLPAQVPGLRTEETSLGVKFYLFISSRTSLSGSVAALLGCRDSGRTPYLANRHYCGLNSECGLISVGSVVCVG